MQKRNILRDSALNYTTFSKECISSNECKLHESLNKAINATLVRLSQLDVIPQKLNISRNNYIYTVDHCKVATKVDVIFNYYNLNSSSYKKKNKIRKQIRDEDRVTKLKSKKAKTLPKKYIKQKTPKEDTLIRPRKTLKAKTLEELAEEIRSSIWGLLGILLDESKRITGYEIYNLNIREIDGYFIAEYSYRLFTQEILQQHQPKIYEGEEK